MYPFLGIAMVGLATIHGLGPVSRSPIVVLGMAIGVGLVLSPLVDPGPLLNSRFAQAAPVIVGFVLAGYPLYANGSFGGVIATLLVGVCGTAPLIVPWERVPRLLHGMAPIGGLAIAFGVELAFGLPVLQSFPFVLLPVIFLALYYTTVELAIGAALGVVDLLGVALIHPASGEAGQALVESLILLAFGVLVRSVVLELEKRNRELQDLTQLKSEFLAVLSHEIRTPLNGALGMTSLLLDTNLSGEQREYLQSIQASGDALLNVLNEVVDFSAIEAGHVRLQMMEFEPKRIIHEVVVLYADSAANKGIEIVQDITPELPRRVIGDPGRLRQILLNLVGNALKFTESGKVVVHAERWQISGPATGIRFDVTDTGVGLTEAEKSRIFAVYSQLDSSNTRRHGGAGLGLAIARMLVDMMGGDLGVESEKGRGSRFWFTARFRRASIGSTEQSLVRSEAASTSDD